MHLLRGVIQHYDWGTTSFIPELIGDAPTTKPCAELWFGTHSLAPSEVFTAQTWLPLADLTGELDVLVKVLSAQTPLSLQVHPSAQQARIGFLRETNSHIDPSQRCYQDQNEKSELLIALTRFEALCGFAPVKDSVALLRSLGCDVEADILQNDGIASYLSWAYSCGQPVIMTDAPTWLNNLVHMYPNDPSLRVAPLLNYIVLNVGEAIALGAGNLHAYLGGSGVEVMTSSDNVVRAGFTRKHVAVQELLSIVDTRVLADPVQTPQRVGTALQYQSPSSAFGVQVLEIDGVVTIGPESIHRILVCVDGSTDELARGSAGVMLPHESLELHGNARIFVCAGSR
ncbi:MAG: mannose-6-phosphate isomerase, class I [Ilumatobacteraceae bacterium]|nr:mannose-6-phosphate isomerase, class I [Ilumatobacteraceae bacterium]